MSEIRGRLLLAATSDESLLFLDGFPQFLVEQGWDVHVVASPGPRLDAFSDVPGVTTHALAMRRNPSPVHDLRSLVAWWRLLGSVRPDALLVGTPKASLLALIASRLRRVPVRVYHVLGLRLESSQGVARTILRTMEQVTAACATHVLSVSASLADALTREGVVARRRIDVLGAGSSNGVDTERFSPVAIAPFRDAARASLGAGPDCLVAGFVGRLNADKGLDTLVAALDLLRDLENLRLVVVGAVDEANAAGTESLSRDPRVHLVGYSDDTREWYAGMDVVLLPTLREGLPNVVLEASACGIAVVVSNATGAIDAVVDGVTGLVFPVGNASALAEAITALHDDGALRAELGRRGRHHVVSNFERREVWAAHDRYLASAVPEMRTQR